MPTISAAGAGNWSAGGTWTGGVAPGDTDTAAIGNYAIVMDIATIPAAGTLAGITFGTGSLTINMSAAGLNGNATINCGSGNIQAGTNNNGSIQVSVATTNTLTINGNLLGGAGSSDICLLWSGASNNGNITVVGNVSGGGGATACGIYLTTSNYSGSITITGNISGGAGAAAMGVALTNAGAIPTITLNSCNLIDGTGGVALWCVKPPTTWNVGTTNYITKGGQNWYYDVPAAANVRETDTVAGVTGTVLTKTLSSANDTVAAGYYAATTLSAEDTDLAAANIVTGKTIFGIAGSASGGSGGGKSIPNIASI